MGQQQLNINTDRFNAKPLRQKESQEAINEQNHVIFMLSLDAPSSPIHCLHGIARTAGYRLQHFSDPYQFNHQKQSARSKQNRREVQRSQQSLVKKTADT